jgi:hypothetical protein
MVTRLADTLAGTVDAGVRRVVIPVTGLIPVLARTGLLFAGVAALWAVFLGALVLDPSALDAAWAALTALALPVQALAWLLFLPLTAGLWAWSTDWALVVRLAVVVGIAGWNLLVFLPRRDAAATPASA